MSRRVLERSVRGWVARGSGLDPVRVLMGQQTGNIPSTGVYASVTMVHEMPVGMQGHQQRIGETASFTIDVQLLKTTFNIAFYRDGCIDAANRFAMWARSESGTTWAATALTCGRLAGVNVYNGGSGYASNDAVLFPHDVDDEAPNATASGAIELDLAGGIRAITLDTGGNNYSTMPNVEIETANGRGASAAARGYGFTVDRIRLYNETMDISSEFEERAMIDVDISHARIYNDVHSGRVESIIGGLDTFLPRGTGGTIEMGGISYLFQKNLYPVNLGVTRNIENHPGIGLQRLSDWLVDTAINTGSSGFAETTLLSEAAIAPDHGRDLLATSPFITNYEGNIYITSGAIQNSVLGSSSEIAIVYLKTTHVIQGMPNNIVSIRAFWNPLSIAPAQTGYSVVTLGIDLNRFNSMVMLSGPQTDGGVIGLQIDIGVGIATNISGVNALLTIKDLNQNRSVAANREPINNISFIMNGNNTRVTFMQHTLDS